MTKYVKYPRTFHLPWSPGATSDDKVLANTNHFIGKKIVVTEKMDGENTTMYKDHIHARSLDSAGGIDRDWVKMFWSTFSHDIPDNYRICGENMWARHSIHYTNLKSYFYGFSIWDGETCLDWDIMLMYFQYFDIVPVPVVYKGIWNEELIRSINIDDKEGYVVRLADSFEYKDFGTSVAKYVRANHVQTDEHWRQQAFVPNVLVDSIK